VKLFEYHPSTDSGSVQSLFFFGASLSGSSSLLNYRATIPQAIYSTPSGFTDGEDTQGFQPHQQQLPGGPHQWTALSKYSLQFQRRPPKLSRIAPRVMLEKGAIGRVHPLIHLLPRSKEGSFHPIPDLKHLNMFLKTLPFQMLRAADVLQSVLRKFFQFSFMKQAHQI